MRILIMASSEDTFDVLADELNNIYTIISSDDIYEEADSHETLNDFQVAFFTALYNLTAPALSRREDVLLDCSKVSEEERAKLIRALNNTSGLEMKKIGEEEGQVKYQSR